MGNKWLFFLAVVVIIVIGLGTYATFSYWDISEGNKWSTFFGFTSTFGILVTIGVYLKGRYDDLQKQFEIDRKLLPEIIMESNKLEEKIINILDIINPIRHGYYETSDLKLKGYTLLYLEHSSEEGVPTTKSDEIDLTYKNEYTLNHGNHVYLSYNAFNFFLTVSTLGEVLFKSVRAYQECSRYYNNKTPSFIEKSGVNIPNETEINMSNIVSSLEEKLLDLQITRKKIIKKYNITFPALH